MRERLAKRHEVTVAGLVEKLEEIREQAVQNKQYSSAVAALREIAILAGKRVQRSESGDPGEFDKLTEEELDRLLAAEYERIQEVAKAANDEHHTRRGAKLFDNGEPASDEPD